MTDKEKLAYNILKTAKELLAEDDHKKELSNIERIMMSDDNVFSFEAIRDKSYKNVAYYLKMKINQILTDKHYLKERNALKKLFIKAIMSNFENVTVTKKDINVRGGYRDFYMNVTFELEEEGATLDVYSNLFEKKFLSGNIELAKGQWKKTQRGYTANIDSEDYHLEFSYSVTDKRDYSSKHYYSVRIGKGNYLHNIIDVPLMKEGGPDPSFEKRRDTALRKIGKLIQKVTGIKNINWRLVY